jgi:diguanylate cyclase (GGDEF)-like protein
VERSGMSMALVLIDLDHFKRVNDTYGHQVGDQVLQAFAQAAQSALRETDIIGRWGGEEFVVLLPDTFPADRAMIAVERIQAILADAQLCPGVPSLRVSFSAGVAVPRTGESLDAMLERADRALYAAKEQGRRRAIVAP